MISLFHDIVHYRRFVTGLGSKKDMTKKAAGIVALIVVASLSIAGCANPFVGNQPESKLKAFVTEYRTQLEQMMDTDQGQIRYVAMGGDMG
jgi:hypothetical protein